MKYSKISPKAENYIFTVILLISFLIIGVMFLLGFLLSTFWTAKYNVIIYGLVLIDVLLTMIGVLSIPKMIQENYGYYTDQKKIEARYGIFYINRKMVLFKHIYKVVITKKIIGRMFGISCVVLSTSAGNIKIGFLDQKQVDKLCAVIDDKMHEM